MTTLNRLTKTTSYSVESIHQLLEVAAGGDTTVFHALSQSLAGDDTMAEEIRLTLQSYNEDIRKLTGVELSAMEKRVIQKNDIVLTAAHVYKNNIFLFKLQPNKQTYLVHPYKVDKRNDINYIMVDENAYRIMTLAGEAHVQEEEFVIDHIVRHTGNSLKTARYLVKFKGWSSKYNLYYEWNEIKDTAALTAYLKILDTRAAKDALRALDREEQREARKKKKDDGDNSDSDGDSDSDSDSDSNGKLDEPDGLADEKRVAANKFTRRRLTKRLTGRKYGVLRDDYGLYKRGGCYCFMPYDKTDDKNKCLFKIGMSLDFTKRIDEYHTYFPEGVYSVAFLVEPVVAEWDVNRKKEWIARMRQKNMDVPQIRMTMGSATKTEKFKEIEAFLFTEVEKAPSSVRLHSTTRVRHADPETKKGATEWIYSDCETIHRAFEAAHAKYPGGELLKFYFKGIDPVTGKIITSINDAADEKRSKLPGFTGQITHQLN